jgi:WD40 repeat protein
MRRDCRPASALSARELLLVLEEELQRLPASHRMAVVTCCLEGHSRDEAAALLGCTVGALRGWLERGRARLHERLVRRGIAMTAALATAEAVGGTVDAAVMTSAVSAAMGTASATVVRLAAGGTLVRLRLARLTVLMLGSGAMWLMAGSAPVREEPLPQPVHTGADVRSDPLPPDAVARIGSSRFRAGKGLTALAYASGGKVIVAAHEQGVVQFWDAASGKMTNKVAVDAGQNAAIACRADGRTVDVFSGSTYYAFDVATGKELQKRVLFEKARPLFARFSADGSALACVLNDEPNRVIDPATGKERFRFLRDGAAMPDLAGMPRRTLLATVSRSSAVHIYDGETGKPLYTWQTPLESVERVHLAPDGKLILCAQRYKELAIVMDTATGNVLCGLPTKCNCAAFSPDSRYVAIGSLPDGAVYEARTGKEICRLRNRLGFAHLAFSPDSKLVLGATLYGEMSQWDVITGTALAASAEPIGGIEVIRFTDDGNRLLTYNYGYRVHEWTTGRLVRRYAGPTPDFSTHRLLSPDGQVFATLDAATVVLQNAANGQELCRVQGVRPMGRVPFFSEDSRRLFIVESDNAIAVVDTATGKALHRLKGHKGRAGQFAMSADGRLLVCVSWDAPEQNRHDGAIVWDVTNGRLLQRIGLRRKHVAALALAPDGTELAIAERIVGSRPPSCEIRFLDPRSGQERRSFVAQPGPTCLRFSPDGRTLLIADFEGGTLSLRDAATGNVRHRFQGGYDFAVYDAVFSADGSLLASSSWDSPAYVWDVYGKHGKAAAAEQWSDDDANRLWRQLAGSDGEAAFQAIRRLVRNPTPAVALLRRHLKSAKPLDSIQVTTWLANLDDADFTVRQTAYAELARLGDWIEESLRRALADERSVEAKRRIEALLARAASPTPDNLRRGRALEALEQVATPDALRLLETLAAGEPSARVTREAGTALARLRKRAPR